MKKYIFDGHKLSYHPGRVNQFLTEGDCFPLYMEISPIGACNSRCIFCAYDFIGYPDRRLDKRKFFEFVDEISKCGLKSILYAGEGEPLLHPDIAEFIIHSSKSGIDAGVYTNGQLLKEELAGQILPSLTFIRFSFNGGTKENYEKIHRVRPEIFDVVIKNIETAVKLKGKNKLNLDIGAQFVLLPENISSLINAVKILKDLGVDYLAVKPFVQQSDLQSYQIKEQFSVPNINDILLEAEGYSEESFKVVARIESFAEYGNRDYENCYGTSFISVMNSAGEIASCLPYWDNKEFVFGNIYENSFRDIWSGDKRKAVKNYLENKLSVKICPPNCRPNAINGFLSELKKPSVSHVNFI